MTSKNECGCERGEDCTKTTVCAAQARVEQLEETLRVVRDWAEQDTVDVYGYKMLFATHVLMLINEV